MNEETSAACHRGRKLEGRMRHADGGGYKGRPADEATGRTPGGRVAPRFGHRRQQGGGCGTGRLYGTRGANPGPGRAAGSGRARFDDAGLDDHLMMGKGLPVVIVSHFGRTVRPLRLLWTAAAQRHAGVPAGRNRPARRSGRPPLRVRPSRVRELPGGVFHCPACRSEVLAIGAQAIDTRRKGPRGSAT